MTRVLALEGRWAPVVGVLVLSLAAQACQKHEFDAPERAARLAEAEAAYDPAAFDTVTWNDPEEMLIVGADVYAIECRDCHGPLGRGQTEYNRVHNLDVPSLVEPDWEYAELHTLRHVVFSGHGESMPIHGIAGLTPREIDAVSRYVVEQLRPEVLGTLERPEPGTP